MVTQHYRRCADADMPYLAPLEFNSHFIEAGKKRLDVFEKFFPFRSQRKWPPVKESCAKVFLQLGDLRADGGLLDAVGDVSHRWHDAAMPRDVIKEFEM